MSGSGGSVPSSAIWRTQAGSQSAASRSWPGWSLRTLAIWAIAARMKPVLNLART
jgi:hypothetical protein